MVSVDPNQALKGDKMVTIDYFIRTYEESIEHHLKNLYKSLGSRNEEEWATALYVQLRDDPNNSVVCGLNRDRKACLTFLYDLVDTIENSPNPSTFASEVILRFKIWRIKKILGVCMIMDRCQALFRMQLPTSTSFGMHWYSNLHLEPNTLYSLAYPEEQQMWVTMLNTTKYEGRGTMNKRIFKLLYQYDFGLLADAKLLRWSRPTPAIFTTLTTPIPSPEVVSAVAPSSIPLESISGFTGLSISQSVREIIQGYVDMYDQPEYQDCLARLYDDRRSQDPEEWARLLYTLLRDDPLNERALALNRDRKKCMSLLYHLVDEWEMHGFSEEFELGIKQVFKSRRLFRILSVCLIMDRCQSLYKMEIFGGQGVGMHWFSELHFNETTVTNSAHQLSFDEFQMWKTLLSNYVGRGTMNKRLYRLLYSKILGLQQNELMLRWSKPRAALFFSSNDSVGIHSHGGHVQ